MRKAGLLLLIVLAVSSCSYKNLKPGGGSTVMASPYLMKLPDFEKKGDVSMEEALSLRKSVRNFTSRELKIEEISKILWAAQGINREDGKRTCPSAGATYPLETYAVTREGVFHYSPEYSTLKLVADGDVRESLSNAALGQSCVKKAPLIVVFCAVYERTMSKYGERGLMYVHMEAGHAAQNIHLQAVAMGLGSVPVGAFKVEEVEKILKLPAEQDPIYMIPIGYPAE